MQVQMWRGNGINGLMEEMGRDYGLKEDIFGRVEGDDWTRAKVRTGNPLEIRYEGDMWARFTNDKMLCGIWESPHNVIDKMYVIGNLNQDTQPEIGTGIEHGRNPLQYISMKNLVDGEVTADRRVAGGTIPSNSPCVVAKPRNIGDDLELEVTRVGGPGPAELVSQSNDRKPDNIYV